MSTESVTEEPVSIFERLYTDLVAEEHPLAYFIEGHIRQVHSSHGVELHNTPYEAYVDISIKGRRVRLHNNDYTTHGMLDPVIPEKGDRNGSHDIIRHICVYNIMPMAELTMHALNDDLAGVVLQLRSAGEDNR